MEKLPERSDRFSTDRIDDGAKMIHLHTSAEFLPSSSVRPGSGSNLDVVSCTRFHTIDVDKRATREF